MNANQRGATSDAHPDGRYPGRGPVTLFSHPDGAPAKGSRAGPDAPTGRPAKQLPRWVVRNWPVRWKVLAIALLPMALAIAFGGLRIAGALTEAGRLRLAADRAVMVPAITDYMSALGSALVAASSGGDAQGAKRGYENRKYELQSRMADTDVAPDVRSGVTTVLERGQSLLDAVLANSIGLRDRVTGYAPILMTAQDAINGSVRLDNERIRAETEGLSRAVGARGQMMMQQLLVDRGGELPEQDLRTAMITVAGTEPSTLLGMNQVLGVDSPDAKKLQQQLVTRMAVMSDPASVLPNNPVLQDSIHSTDAIAARVIERTSGSVIQSVDDRAAAQRDAVIRDIVLMLAAIGLALAAVWLVARSLVQPLRTLRDGALQVAHTDLENEIAQVRAGSAGSERDPAPLPVHTTEEVGQVAHAVDELHAQALLLAGDEARLRLLVNDMFETMSRRNRSLVDQQLSLIERLERDEDDPDRLDSLFRLDHLAARMRRNGANLLVLAGAQISHEKGRSVPLATAINAATSEVEGYRRVETAMVPDVMVVGAATGDAIHLFAELIDNALRYSPPTAPVQVCAESAADDGVLVQIVDSGLGMIDTDLRIANMRLSTGGEATPENARHMGLFVVGRLAQRHRIRVWLSPTSPAGRGITARVYLPPSLLVGAIGGIEGTGGTGGFGGAGGIGGFGSTGGIEGTGGFGGAGAIGGRDSRDSRDSREPRRTPAVVVSPVPTQIADEQVTRAGEPTISPLPRRSPGSSGITGMPTEPPAVAGNRSPAEAAPDVLAGPGQSPDPPAAPAGLVAPAGPAGQSPAGPAAPDPLVSPNGPAPPGGTHVEDVIYQRMMSEWLVDPHELGRSADLDWKSVWDHGWTLAAEAENAPVTSHTEQGLPIREPGIRLVPGSVDRAGQHRAEPGRAERPASADNMSRRPAHQAPERDPDAIRSSIASHFGGVHAARSRAAEADWDIGQGLDDE